MVNMHIGAIILYHSFLLKCNFELQLLQIMGLHHVCFIVCIKEILLLHLGHRGIFIICLTSDYMQYAICNLLNWWHSARYFACRKITFALVPPKFSLSERTV